MFDQVFCNSGEEIVIHNAKCPHTGDWTICLQTVCPTDSLPNDNMPTGHLAYGHFAYWILYFLRKQKKLFLFNFIYFHIFTPIPFYTLITMDTH